MLLRDYPYYSDQYDRLTVEECRAFEQMFKRFAASQEPPLPNNAAVSVQSWVDEVALYCLMGERYVAKDDTIRRWMQQDCERDEHLNQAKAPSSVSCLRCGMPMTCGKPTLHPRGKRESALFFFDCSDCGKRRAFWEGDEEWEPEGRPCPQCSHALQEEDKREGSCITTISRCTNCGFEKSDILTLDVTREPLDPNFEADRKRFCLSSKDGQDYLSQQQQLRRLEETIGNKELEGALKEIKMLTVAELQALLGPVLSNAGYLQFTLDVPDLNRDVVVGFRVQDAKPDRSRSESSKSLERLVGTTLRNTNWRLMGEGVTDRLGVLTGRLCGTDRGEELEAVAQQILERKTIESDSSRIENVS